MAGVASKRAPTASSLVILARDGSKSGGASARNSITAGSVFQPRPGDSAALDSIPSSASVPRDGRSSAACSARTAFQCSSYFREKLRDDPWLLLRTWEDISSFGGMLGGIAGALLFFATRAEESERRARLLFLDAVAFVFPAALAIGRLGCSLAHDHPGTVTISPRSPLFISRCALRSTRCVSPTRGTRD